MLPHRPGTAGGVGDWGGGGVFPHVEFLPVMEHPFYGSWGYQTPGPFPPPSRYGSPQRLVGAKWPVVW